MNHQPVTPWDNPLSYAPDLYDQLAVVEHYEKLVRKARRRGRFGFANRAGRASTEPQSSFRLGLSATIAIACVALSLLTLAYFAAEFLR